MDRYVIHVYHRDPKDPMKFFGVVEKLGGKRRVGFLGPDSLWKILGSTVWATKEKEKTRKKSRMDREVKSFAEIMELIREEQEEMEE